MKAHHLASAVDLRRLPEPTPEAMEVAQIQSLLAVGLKPRDVAERLRIHISVVMRVLTV